MQRRAGAVGPTLGPNPTKPFGIGGKRRKMIATVWRHRFPWAVAACFPLAHRMTSPTCEWRIYNASEYGVVERPRRPALLRALKVDTLPGRMCHKSAMARKCCLGISERIGRSDNAGSRSPHG